MIFFAGRIYRMPDPPVFTQSSQGMRHTNDTKRDVSKCLCMHADIMPVSLTPICDLLKHGTIYDCDLRAGTNNMHAWRTSLNAKVYILF